MKRDIDPQPRSVAVVGNAPDMTDQGACIDAADWVVRFNNAAGFGARAGRRVTHLALVNHGGQMREWLEDPDFVRRPVVRGAGIILFPFPRKDGPADDRNEDGRDWTRQAEVRLAPLGAEIAMLPDCVHRDARTILGASCTPAAVPSTGFLVTLHLLAILSRNVAIGIHGFGFEGWDGHGWQAERRWFEAMRGAGRLNLHALDANLAP
ncbi:hypothetical protein ASG43_16790 [Aureimonas sp. Leaf454]|uniref:hypothetical protein n=1 Tax=Aureimonas sp. Leaf454 TaxID=1736381 RepID=UPI0006FE9042|nr:hypothetical protein [Aureimonas sp. Leaf454]KQT43159.1 hypothetical protein ASG43_16790 [Aureimonas sp. Leaf454]